MHFLKIEGLYKSFGGLMAIHNLEFEVEEGEIVACINVGGYNQAMQMPHCLRPPAPAVYFEDRVATP